MMLVLLCISVAVMSTLAHAQLPDDIRAEDVARAQRNIFSTMSSEEKTMLIRCQLCHDILDSIKAYVQDPELIRAGQSGAQIAPQACAIVAAALTEGGPIYAQRGADYGKAALKLVEEACGLLMDDIAPQYVAYIDNLLDGTTTEFTPCDSVCPGAADRQKQTERMTEALRSIKAADQQRAREQQQQQQRVGGRSPSSEPSWVTDVLLVGGLAVVAWLSIKAYRLAAVASNGSSGKKNSRRK